MTTAQQARDLTTGDQRTVGFYQDQPAKSVPGTDGRNSAASRARPVVWGGTGTALVAAVPWVPGAGPGPTQVLQADAQLVDHRGPGRGGAVRLHRFDPPPRG